MTEAQSLRVQIGKNLQLYDRHVTELKYLENDEGEDDSDEDEFAETQAELVAVFGKIKTANAVHRMFVFRFRR